MDVPSVAVESDFACEQLLTGSDSDVSDFYSHFYFICKDLFIFVSVYK